MMQRQNKSLLKAKGMTDLQLFIYGRHLEAPVRRSEIILQVKSININIIKNRTSVIERFRVTRILRRKRVHI